MKHVAVLRMTQHIVSKICCTETFISQGSYTQGQELACGQLSIELDLCRDAKTATRVAGSTCCHGLEHWFKLVTSVR